MRGQWVVRGVPDKVRNDGWWLATPAETGGGAGNRTTDRVWGSLRPLPVAGVLALTAMADWLFWGGHLGLSIAIFATSVSICIIAFKPGGAAKHEWSGAILFTLLCNLPVIEQVQAMSVLYSVLGVVAVMLWVAARRVLGAAEAVRLWFRASTVGAATLPVLTAQQVSESASGWDKQRLMQALALPGAVGLVFLVLFTVANPLVEETLWQVSRIGGLDPAQIARLGFWIVVACALWPYLNTHGPWRGSVPSAKPMSVATPDPVTLGGFINRTSVRNSLILFNAMFLIQTISDTAVLSGGVALPEGMSYASYAHRGAYPLLATALLAGAFAILTNGITRDDRELRQLMLLWLGQTLFLVLTAAVRLGHYVDAYTLTYLRVAAFIWMGLVFVGLILTLVYILRARPLAWLMQGNAFVLAMTLYLCCFVNFAHVITTYNLAKAEDIASLDLEYLCNLGEQAIPAMMEVGEITDNVACGRNGLPAIRFDPIEDWREWGFRRWRLQQYLARTHDL